MKAFIATILISILCINCTKESSKSYEDYIPENWEIQQEIKGDLNNDGNEDLVLIIKDLDSTKIIKNDSLDTRSKDFNSRGILILFKDKFNNYELIDKNTIGLIPSMDNSENDCLADPLENIQIENNALKIQFNYWYKCGSSSTTIYKHTYQFIDRNFELVNVEYTDLNRYSAEVITTGFNFINKIKTISKEKFDEETAPIVTKHPLNLLQRIKFNKVNNDLIDNLFNSDKD